MAAGHPDSVLRALADPVRCRLLELLRSRPASVNELAAPFPISRPAISRHLRRLRQAGLVAEAKRGRRRVYRLRTEALEELAGWLAALGVRGASAAATGPGRGRREGAAAQPDVARWRVW